MTSSPSRPAFVVFEGLDGSGKSTCARLVAKLLRAVYLTTPSPVVRSHRDQIVESFNRCQEAGQLFYLSTVFAASQDVRSHIEQGSSVVLDRYFLSTQAYAAFRGSKLDLDRVGELLVPADLTVFLDAPLEIRRARLLARGSSAADRETLSAFADEQLRSAHARRSALSVVGRWLCIDARAGSPSAVVDQVLRALGMDPGGEPG